MNSVGQINWPSWCEFELKKGGFGLKYLWSFPRFCKLWNVLQSLSFRISTNACFNKGFITCIKRKQLANKQMLILLYLWLVAKVNFKGGWRWVQTNTLQELKVHIWSLSFSKFLVLFCKESFGDIKNMLANKYYIIKQLTTRWSLLFGKFLQRSPVSSGRECQCFKPVPPLLWHLQQQILAMTWENGKENRDMLSMWWVLKHCYLP